MDDQSNWVATQKMLQVRADRGPSKDEIRAFARAGKSTITSEVEDVGK